MSHQEECIFQAQRITELEKELDEYKKALYEACEELGEFCCNQTMLRHKCDSDCSKHWNDYFLQKARKE